jgi:hypothetical protein
MIRTRVVAPLLVLLACCGQGNADTPPAPPPPPQPVPRSCGVVEQAAQALAQSVSTCRSDADCRAQPLPGGCPPAFACHLFVNVSVDVEAVSKQARALSEEYAHACGRCIATVAECGAPGTPVCRDQHCRRAPQ